MKKLVSLCALLSACSPTVQDAQACFELYLDMAQKEEVVPSLNDANRAVYAARVSKEKETAAGFMPLHQIQGLVVEQQLEKLPYAAISTPQGDLPCKDIEGNYLCATDESILSAAIYLTKKETVDAYQHADGYFDKLSVRLKNSYHGFVDGWRSVDDSRD